MPSGLKLLCIGLIVLFSGCYSQLLSAPRSATEFGSKRLLNSYASINQHLEIVEYNADLSISFTHQIQDEQSGWWDVASCDHYYLTLSSIQDNFMTLNIFTLHNSSAEELNQITIPLNVTRSAVQDIAVSPSGRNFVFFNGSHLLVFEVDLQTFNWTITAEESVVSYLQTMGVGLTMSDTKISFVFNYTNQFIYNYKTHTATLRSLPSAWAITAVDTYNDYWVYASNKDILLEDPAGNLHAFNFTDFIILERVSILPPQLCTSPDSIDVALSAGVVILGTLNATTQRLEVYNTVPSKSLGLEYKPEITEGRTEALLNFVVGHNVLLFQIYDAQRTVALAAPSAPGNHSCSMHRGERLITFWCGNRGRDPTNYCPPGTYQPSHGFASCLLCPEGTYQPHEGSIDCLPCKDKEYCPLGTFTPEVISEDSLSQAKWTFPISATSTSFEEILLMLMFASSLAASKSPLLWGWVAITSALLLSLLVQYFAGINLHQWLAKIDIHKKTRYKVKPKPNGGYKIEAVKVESVFGGYLMLVAAFILLVGLITTISYVSDYHPLLVGQDNNATEPSANSVRTASVQDYNTQSEASELANIIKDNLSVNITVVMYNFQSFVFPNRYPLDDPPTITNCYDQYGDGCTFQVSDNFNKSTAAANIQMQMNGPLRFSEADVTITTAWDSYFTFATVEVSTSFSGENNASTSFEPSKANYLVLPGKNKALTGLLLIPITMTVVVRETELANEEFNHHGYMSFVSDEAKLHNMGHSSETFAETNEPLSFQFMLQLDNNWRLESEQRRFGGVGAFFAALLAILGLYEVTLLVSELAHRVFHSIEKRHKKRSKYQPIEDPPLMVNEKFE